VVAALGRLGAHILALRKSEPSLEDVFVELVGRGFDDVEIPDERPPDRPKRRRTEADGRSRATDDSRERETEEVA
jgi:hypothetical protein